MLVAHRERLLLAKVEVLGVVVDQLGLGRARGLGAGAHDAVEGHEALPGDVVDLLVGPGVAQAEPEGVGEVLDVAELGDLEARAGDRDGPAGGDPVLSFFLFMTLFSEKKNYLSISLPFSLPSLSPHSLPPFISSPVEEPLLDGVVVQGPVDVHWPDRRPVDAARVEQRLGLALALVPRLGVGRVALDVRRLVRLEVDAGGRAENVLLEPGQRVQDRLGLGGLAAVEVVDDVKRRAHRLELGDQGIDLLAVGGDVLDLGLVLGVGRVGVVGDLRRDRRLATREQRDLVAGLDQVAREVDANEARAAEDEDVLLGDRGSGGDGGGDGGRGGDGGDGEAARGDGAAGRKGGGGGALGLEEVVEVERFLVFGENEEKRKRTERGESASLRRNFGRAPPTNTKRNSIPRRGSSLFLSRSIST